MACMIKIHILKNKIVDLCVFLDEGVCWKSIEDLCLAMICFERTVINDVFNFKFFK